MKPAVTPQASPAPSERPTPKSGVTKRPRKAAPLSDVTNLLLPETRTPIKPRRRGRRTHPHSQTSSTCSSPAAVLEEECSVIKSSAIVTGYARWGTAQASEGRGRKANPTTNKGKGKGKEPTATAAGTASCPQLGKSSRNNDRETSTAQDTRPISPSAPCHEAKKKRPLPNTPKLPEDFVKKQRAYFAAVDAFELPVEEVSEIDMDSKLKWSRGLLKMHGLLCTEV